MEYYIGLLDENPAQTLRMLYIEGLTYMKIAEKLKISTSSVRNFRKAGIRKLAFMFQALTAH
jgi:DNA-directed RNA polymerase specialized sigma24 family protein